jgi:hypothetical protein
MDKEDVIFLMGELTSPPKIADRIHSCTLQGWIQFQEQGLYLKLGYENFNDFLTNHPKSPMSRSQFYEKKKLLLKEGAPLFDLFNRKGISERKRKLLREGSIEVHGDKVVIRQDGNDQNIEIDLNDNDALVETLTEVVDQNAVQKSTIKRDKEFRGRAEKKIEALNNEVSTVKETNAAKLPSSTKSLMNLMGAGQLLVQQLKSLPEKDAHCEADKALTEISVITAQLQGFVKEGEMTDKDRLEMMQLVEKSCKDYEKEKENEIIH